MIIRKHPGRWYWYLFFRNSVWGFGVKPHIENPTDEDIERLRMRAKELGLHN